MTAKILESTATRFVHSSGDVMVSLTESNGVVTGVLTAKALNTDEGISAVVALKNPLSTLTDTERTLVCTMFAVLVLQKLTSLR